MSILFSEFCRILRGGHRILAEGVHTAKSKVAAIQEAPVPKNMQELHSFLGLLNYYANFIPSLLQPLHVLLQTCKSWTWFKECSAAFSKAKSLLSSAPECPIAYASRTLNPSERNYAQVEKEALSFMLSVKRFHQYIYAREFMLIIDHKPLTTVLRRFRLWLQPVYSVGHCCWLVIHTALNSNLLVHSNADGLAVVP